MKTTENKAIKTEESKAMKTTENKVIKTEESKVINKSKNKAINISESKAIKTNIDNFVIRFAEPKDTGLLLDFIKLLAEYEKRLEQVIATEEDLCEVFFERKIAEAIIGEYLGKPVSFAVFLYNFSTFTGKPNIYIEDMFVDPKMRGKGIGSIMFSFIAKLALDRKCGRLEWTVLKWNEPSIKFYKSLGSKPKDEWDIYKLEGTALKNLADRFK